jgi:hypothetical protein
VEEYRSEDRKERKPRKPEKGVLPNRLLLWATGAQPHQGTLGHIVEDILVLPYLRMEELDL